MSGVVAAGIYLYYSILMTHQFKKYAKVLCGLVNEALSVYAINQIPTSKVILAMQGTGITTQIVARKETREGLREWPFIS